MFKHQFLERVPVYAVGALTGSEKQQFEDHLGKGCEVCEVELTVFMETAHRLPYALPNYRVPGGLKQKVMDTIDQFGEPL